MKVTKGTIIEVKHTRKGRFTAIADEDFDTDIETFFPVSTTMKVEGFINEWEQGESIPCRASLCTVSVIESANPPRPGDNP